MKAFSLFFLLPILGIVFNACNNGSQEGGSVAALSAVLGDVVIYSTPTCETCTVLKGQLDSDGIAYNEYNIETTTYYNQMMTDVQSYASWYSTGYQISLPVVRVKSTNVLENPSVSEIQASL